MPANNKKPWGEVIHVTELDKKADVPVYALGCEVFQNFYERHKNEIREQAIKEPLITYRSIFLAGFIAGKDMFSGTPEEIDCDCEGCQLIKRCSVKILGAILF